MVEALETYGYLVNRLAPNVYKESYTVTQAPWKRIALIEWLGPERYQVSIQTKASRLVRTQVKSVQQALDNIKAHQE